MSTYTGPIEELKVAGSELKSVLKGIIREGNVRRVVIKNASGRTVLVVPLAAGVVGAVLAPFWAAVAGLAALAANYTVVIERTEAAPKPPAPAKPTS
jgi:hypothetical protein